MAEVSSIQWTDSSWNPWRGCTRVSEGCRFCYAERQAKRNPRVLGVWGPQGTRVLASEAQWKAPQRWNADWPGQAHPSYHPFHLVFTASIADIFEDWRGQMTDSQERPLWHRTDGAEQPWAAQSTSDDWAIPYTMNHARARLWDLIRSTPNLRWQILTKRPENIPRMMPAGRWPNVWLGTSVENQEEVWRIDALLEAPQEVPVRFLSVEPMLGPLSIWDQLPGIQWCIIGGESGAQARSMNLAWVRSLMLQCKDANTPVFVKQLGKRPIDITVVTQRPYPLTMAHDTGHGGDLRDWPHDLRIRQFPNNW